ncbi:MAG: hypothetical protein GEV04_21110 [Actinophytocola sp.]|nr:hypothetical protein [Actinophytocola sp.]
MTDITPDHQPADDVIDIPEQAGTESLVPAELRGSPFAAPGVMVTRAEVADGRLKIPCANGYDHFEFDSYVTRNGELIPVFAWTDRTRVAE